MPGMPCSVSTSMPESSAREGKEVSSDACRALMSAFSTKLKPVSSASGTSSSFWASNSTPHPASTARISRSLPALLLARTILRMRLSRKRFVLDFDDLPDAVRSKRQHGIEFVRAEGVTFGRALHLDEGTGIIHDDVHVGFGGRVLLIIKIEHRHALVDADRHRCHRAIDRILHKKLALHQMSDRIPQGY